MHVTWSNLATSNFILLVYGKQERHIKLISLMLPRGGTRISCTEQSVRERTIYFTKIFLKKLNKEGPQGKRIPRHPLDPLMKHSAQKEIKGSCKISLHVFPTKYMVLFQRNGKLKLYCIVSAIGHWAAIGHWEVSFFQPIFLSSKLTKSQSPIFLGTGAWFN